MYRDHSQHSSGPCGVMEPSAILRYLRPENSKFKTVLYMRISQKLPNWYF